MPHPRLRVLAAVLCTLALPTLAGCMVEKAQPKPRTTRNEQNFELDVEPILRGTIMSESIMIGFEPTVVRGYGLVVGLK